MSSTMMFFLAVGGVSAIIYWMTTRLGDPGSARRSTHDSTGTGPDYGTGSASSIGGRSISNWFSSSSSSHDSSSSSDFGSSGGDSGGGGDGGGGGGGD